MKLTQFIQYVTGKMPLGEKLKIKHENGDEGASGLVEMPIDTIETGSLGAGTKINAIWNLGDTGLALRAQGTADAAKVESLETKQELEEYKTETNRRLAELEMKKTDTGSPRKASGTVEANEQMDLPLKEERGEGEMKIRSSETIGYNGLKIKTTRQGDGNVKIDVKRNDRSLLEKVEISGERTKTEIHGFCVRKHCVNLSIRDTDGINSLS
jgi:hypothetical protein